MTLCIVACACASDTELSHCLFPFVRRRYLLDSIDPRIHGVPDKAKLVLISSDRITRYQVQWRSVLHWCFLCYFTSTAQALSRRHEECVVGGYCCTHVESKDGDLHAGVLSTKTGYDLVKMMLE